LHESYLVHGYRNVIAKVPAHAQADGKRDSWAVFHDIEAARLIA
jgi:putative transposase